MHLIHREAVPLPLKGKADTRSIREIVFPCRVFLAPLSTLHSPLFYMTFGAGNVTAVTFSMNSDAILGGYAEIQLYGRVTLS